LIEELGLPAHSVIILQKSSEHIQEAEDCQKIMISFGTVIIINRFTLWFVLGVCCNRFKGLFPCLKKEFFQSVSTIFQTVQA
ncbi:hypothetical protein CROQUDRAFT_698888, partial [Cronartium quercuum f. sp. fusiforme G11]